MHPQLNHLQTLTRRHFLRQSQIGLGAVALASLMSKDASADRTRAADPLSPKPPHFAAKAKRVIYLHLTGSPPHLDLFDYKPELVKRSGQDCPDEFVQGKRFAFTSGTPKLLGTPRSFAQYGEGGVWMSDAIPHLHEVADELCVVRSMTTDQFNHAPAELLLYTGSPRSGRPSMGAWVTYGLGTENENLPGYVVLQSGNAGPPHGGVPLYSNGFLPARHQGSILKADKAEALRNIRSPAGNATQPERLSLARQFDFDFLAVSGHIGLVFRLGIGIRHPDPS
jgi:hypothetical protein